MHHIDVKQIIDSTRMHGIHGAKSTCPVRESGVAARPRQGRMLHQIHHIHDENDVDLKWVHHKTWRHAPPLFLQTGDDLMPLWTEFEDTKAVNEFRAFAKAYVRPAAARLDKEDLYPSDIVRQAARQGLNALIVPRQYGGGGTSFRRVVSFFEEIGAASASVAISLNSNFQAQNAILRSGNEHLKEEFLPGFSRGLTAAYALTERNHGSDIRSLDTKATWDGSQWRLSGQKSFITSGSGAELFIILAQTEQGLGVFAVPRDISGVSTFVSDTSETFGGRNGPHVELKLDEVCLPTHHLLGEPGKGLKVVLGNLNYSRTLNAAMVIGMARSAFEESLEYTRNRRAFDQSVFDFQGIQWYFAEMLAEIDAARLLLYSAADALDEQRDPERYSSEAKLFCCTVANRVTSHAIQVCGAYGTAVNSPFNRYWRDTKVAEIGGGSMEILKNTIGKFIGRLDMENLRATEKSNSI